METLIPNNAVKMTPIPSAIGGARVLCFTVLDERHKHTGHTRQIVGGVLQERSAGLAICQYDGEEACYLFGCDPKWKAVTDTWHESLEDAKAQAAFEYEGVSDTWQVPKSEER